MREKTSRGVGRRVGAVIAAVSLAFGGALAMGGSASAAPADLPTGNGSLTIHKYEQPTPAGDRNDSGGQITVPGDWVPLGGVDFDIQPITSVDLSTEAGWDTVNGYAGDTSTIPVGDLGAATSGSTNAAGELNFAALPVGAYLVTETSFVNATNPDGPANVTVGSAPFVVTIPVPQGDGTWLMDVHAYPKNSVTEVDKTVSEPTSPGVGATLTWTITAKIPTLSPGENFTGFGFGDTLDPKLDYVAGTGAITVTPAAGGAAVPATSTDTTAGQNVVVDVDAAGLAVVQANQGGTATFTFDTVVNAAGEIKNEATVFVNDPNHTGPGITTPEATSYFGPVQILKHAQGDVEKTLAGAVFTVHASEADAATGANPITVSGETQFTTGDDGTVLIPGLFAGNASGDTKDYWLHEVTPPSGYQAIAGAIGPVTVAADGVTTAVEIGVPNVQKPQINLPLTGGDGAMMLMVAGAGLLLIAAGVAVVTMRRRAAKAAL